MKTPKKNVNSLAKSLKKAKNKLKKAKQNINNFTAVNMSFTFIILYCGDDLPLPPINGYGDDLPLPPINGYGDDLLFTTNKWIW